MRGHARSDSPDDEKVYHKQNQVDDMKAVLDECGVKQAVFLGKSIALCRSGACPLSGTDFQNDHFSSPLSSLLPLLYCQQGTPWVLTTTSFSIFRIQNTRPT